jgi:hypothetical protein
MDPQVTTMVIVKNVIGVPITGGLQIQSWLKLGLAPEFGLAVAVCS